jgi:hypothetical protein
MSESVGYKADHSAERIRCAVAPFDLCAEPAELNLADRPDQQSKFVHLLHLSLLIEKMRRELYGPRSERKARWATSSVSGRQREPLRIGKKSFELADLMSSMVLDVLLDAIGRDHQSNHRSGERADGVYCLKDLVLSGSAILISASAFDRKGG